ncbi:hypothetical protein BGZ92_001123 [Podila epicladia]|nr:hypothetical protein BGZ92_001123 [Podila epicladia]
MLVTSALPLLADFDLTSPPLAPLATRGSYQGHIGPTPHDSFNAASISGPGSGVGGHDASNVLAAAPTGNPTSVSDMTSDHSDQEGSVAVRTAIGHGPFASDLNRGGSDGDQDDSVTI